MLVVSLNIYVGRDFRKSFSPIPLLQAGLTSTLEQDACGCLQSCSWCLRLQVLQPVWCLSAGAIVKCAQYSHSVRLPGSCRKSLLEILVLWPVIVDLPVCFWEPFLACLAFLYWTSALRQRKVNVQYGSIGRKNSVGYNLLKVRRGR